MSLSSYLPQSPTGKAMKKLARMVSLSSVFQTRCGIDETACLERIHILSKDESELMPAAVIGADVAAWDTISGGSKNHMLPTGTDLILCLECEPHPEIPATNRNDRRLEAYDFFSAVVRDIASLSNADDPSSEDGTGHLNIKNIRSDGFAQEFPETTQASTGVRYFSQFRFNWGDQA